MSETLKAITIIQPWASAIACGAKRIETRSWSTYYRGPLLIHAGKSAAGKGFFDYEIAGLFVDWPSWADLPCGAIIAVAELTDCARIDDLWREGNLVMGAKPEPFGLTAQELALGDFTPGRYGWVLSNVRALPTPIPHKGMQRLFDIPASLLPLSIGSQP